jgi:hypothetical protein
VRRHKHRVDTGYPFCEGDVYWDDESVVRLPLGCVFAGVLAGMLGVGGGMVMQPLMLELGLLPDVAAATAAFMMLFTASSTTLQFTLNGMLDWVRKTASFFEFSLCLSRACLGKMIVFIFKNGSNKPFFAGAEHRIAPDRRCGCCRGMVGGRASREEI